MNRAAKQADQSVGSHRAKSVGEPSGNDPYRLHRGRPTRATMAY